MNIPETDQWKLEGSCAICCRANYCKKDCSALKKRKQKIVERAYKDILSKQYPEVNEIEKLF